MKTVLQAILLAALVAAGVWLWLVLFPSPEKVIRQRFVDLARTASVSVNDSDLIRLASARRLSSFFATNVEMNVDLPGLAQHVVMERETIMQAAMLPRSRQVRFVDITVTVAPGKQSAMVDLTVQAQVGGEGDNLVQEMKFNLRKIDGQWLITRVETVHTLSRTVASTTEETG